MNTQAGTETHWAHSLAVFDLETTGIDVETARIVTAHLGVLNAEGQLVERGDWLLDPGVEIPEAATAVHGISTQRARSEGVDAAAGVAGIVYRIRELLGRGIPIIAYNAPYDFTVLDREAVRYNIDPLVSPSPVIDPLVIDKALDRYRKGKRTLEVTAEFYGVPLVGAHDASADAVAAGRVAQVIAARYAAQLPQTATELHAQQVLWAAEQAASFQEYMRRAKDPTFTASGAWPVR